MSVPRGRTAERVICNEPIPHSEEARGSAAFGQLMRKAQAGDQRAYFELLRRATPIVARIARCRGCPGSEVDDLVQDVLLALHSVRHTFNPDRPFGPWLASIASHRVIDALRRRTRRVRYEMAVADLPEMSSESNEQQTCGDPELLMRAISRLPSMQRRAVELLKLRELTLKEESVECGASIAALKVSLHRGLGTLRERLAT